VGRLLAGIKQHRLVSVAPTWAAGGAYLEASSSCLVGAYSGRRWRILGSIFILSRWRLLWWHVAPTRDAGGAYLEALSCLVGACFGGRWRLLGSRRRQLSSSGLVGACFGGGWRLTEHQSQPN
jgi:hypothetical protein